MTKTSGPWVDIGGIADIPVRGARIVKTADGCIAVFRTTENDVFAIDDQLLPDIIA